MSEYGSEGFRVRLRGLSEYGSVAYLVERPTRETRAEQYSDTFLNSLAVFHRFSSKEDAGNRFMHFAPLSEVGFSTTVLSIPRVAMIVGTEKYLPPHPESLSRSVYKYLVVTSLGGPKNGKNHIKNAQFCS